jgi:hypothetical protein
LLPKNGHWGSPVEGRTRRDRGAAELQRAADQRAGGERGAAGSLGGKHGTGRREGMGGLHREEQQSRYLDPLAANKRGSNTRWVRQTKRCACERLGEAEAEGGSRRKPLDCSERRTSEATSHGTRKNEGMCRCAVPRNARGSAYSATLRLQRPHEWCGLCPRPHGLFSAGFTILCPVSGKFNHRVRDGAACAE